MIIAIFSKVRTIDQVCHQLWPQHHGNIGDSLTYNSYMHYFDSLWKFRTLIKWMSWQVGDLYIDTLMNVCSGHK